MIGLLKVMGLGLGIQLPVKFREKEPQWTFTREKGKEVGGPRSEKAAKGLMLRLILAPALLCRKFLT